jgi:hypothetical protein
MFTPAKIEAHNVSRYRSGRKRKKRIRGIFVGQHRESWYLSDRRFNLSVSIFAIKSTA